MGWRAETYHGQHVSHEMYYYNNLTGVIASSAAAASRANLSLIASMVALHVAVGCQQERKQAPKLEHTKVASNSGCDWQAPNLHDFCKFD